MCDAVEMVRSPVFSRVHATITYLINNSHYDEEPSPGSTSFPLPLVVTLPITGVVVGSEDEVSKPFGCCAVGPGALVNCQAGIEGLPKSGNGEEGVLETVGPRLSKRALRDFNSCCNSARD